VAKTDTTGMFDKLARQPGTFAVAMALDLALRGEALDAGPELDQIRMALDYAAGTTIYSTRAKALLVRPLVRQNVKFDGKDWRGCAVQLYALWHGIPTAEVEQRMAALREQYKGNWRKTFPDDCDIDERKLLALYKSSPALLVNGIHDWNEISLSLRFFVAEQLAAAAGDNGIFDWGGSDGISCIFARHHGATDVHLHEPNPAARAFGKWLAEALGLDGIAFHEHDPARPPAGRRFGAGICTEVLEHVVDPPGMIRHMYDLLVPGGILFVTSSFGVPQDTHLKQNVKYAGRERQLMVEAGFEPCAPNVPPPTPFLPQWGFWRRPA
jgi:hypothetical protein